MGSPRGDDRWNLREAEILLVTLGLLAEVGYDRLRLDAVADRAHVSKATIYRHWHGKPCLVRDALNRGLSTVALERDTGSLRTDLMDLLADPAGLGDATLRAALAGISTAMSLTRDVGEAVCREVLVGILSALRQLFHRARMRGEVSVNADVELLSRLVVGFVMFHVPPTVDRLEWSESLVGFVDHVVLPSARRS